MNVHPELMVHPKFKRLKRRVGAPAAEILLRLWGHCQGAQRGEFWRNGDAEYLATVCDWEGQPEELLKHLIDAGWVEEKQNGLVIHDWEDHNGKLVRAWKNGPKGGRKPKANRTSEAKETEQEPNSNPDEPEQETEQEPNSNCGVHRSYGVDREERGEREALAPSLERVLEESKAAGVPSEFAVHYFDTRTSKRTWTNHRGELINWEHELRTWWKKDAPRWNARAADKPPAEYQGRIDQIVAELEAGKADPSRIAQLIREKNKLRGVI